MALVVNDRVKETSTTTGTGTFDLAGAVSGFESFVAGIGNSNTTYYSIVNENGEFEVGLGTVTDAATDTLSRDTIISSSNSDSAVNFGAGTKNVFCTLPASKAVILDSSGNIVANNGSNLTNLNADNLASGTVPDARFPATLPAASGVNLTALNASNVASGTLSSDRLPTVPTTKGGTGLTAIGTANQVLAVNAGATALEFQTPEVGDITAVTAGSGLTGGGTTGDVTLNIGAGNLIDVQADQIDVDLSELTTSTSDADGDFFAVVDAANAQKKLTKANIAISGFNNDSGFIDGSALNASNLSSGTVPDARFPATLPALNGSALTALNASNVSSGTLASDRLPTVPTTKGGTGLTSIGSANQVLAVNSGGTALEFQTPTTGDITGVTAGSGLTGGGSSGDVTLNVGAGALIDVTADAIDVDLSELTTSTSDADGDFFAVVDAANAQKKLTKGNINISGFNNDSGFIDGSSLNASNLDSGTVPDARFPATLPALNGSALTDLNASNLASGTVPNARLDQQLQDVAGLAVTDGNFIVGNGLNFVAESGATARTSLGLGSIATLNTVTLTTNTTGNYVASLTAGALIDVGAAGEGATPSIAVDLSEATDMTEAMVGTDEFIVLDASSQKRKAANEINLSIFNNDLPGDISGVTAGNGLTGGGTTGTVTLNVGAGTGIDVSADAIAVDVSDFMSNGVNNRLLTATGADAMNAEANLTFDGSTLTVTGTAAATTFSGSGASLTSIPNSALDNFAITINGTSTSLGGSINVGDITGVTAGTLLDGGGTTGTVTLDVDLSELTTSTSDADGDFFVVVDSVNAQKKLTKANINNSGFNNDAGYTTNTGTVTSVTGGNGLTGSVTTSGSLAVGAGTGIDVAADSISVDVSDFMSNGSNNRIITATGTDAMNAEANLTFDGSTLAVTGALTTTGNITTDHVLPNATDTYDLGASDNVWRNVYTGDLHLSNEAKEEGNAVDGTKGNWTIQEGAEHLYILNNKSGKKYRFKLEEM